MPALVYIIMIPYGIIPIGSASSPPFFPLKAVSFPAKVAFLAIFTSDYSTVTLFARFLGWSTLLPRRVAIW